MLKYVPQVSQLLSESNPVLSILDSLCADPGWWLGSVKQAQTAFLRDLEQTVGSRHGPCCAYVGASM